MKGNPFFVQPRPGKIDPKTGKEKIFKMIKFRTMTNAKDKEGNLLPDAQRLNSYGRFLRSSSLDETLEIISIARANMSIVGPRPFLVRDLVFMTDEQRMRHTAKPGLSGLAQVMGRNAISWEEKINLDLKYIDRISFLGDIKIVVRTIQKVFGKKEDRAELDITDDYGDALLKAGMVSKHQYDALQKRAKYLIDTYERGK